MPARERTCTAKNRVRELRSPGSVRDEGSNVLVYSDAVEFVADVGRRGPPLDPLLRDALIYSIMPHCNARLNV